MNVVPAGSLVWIAAKPKTQFNRALTWKNIKVKLLKYFPINQRYLFDANYENPEQKQKLGQVSAYCINPESGVSSAPALMTPISLNKEYFLMNLEGFWFSQTQRWHDVPGLKKELKEYVSTIANPEEVLSASLAKLKIPEQLPDELKAVKT